MEYRLPHTSDNLFAQQVTIKNGASESETVGTQGRALVGVIMPAAWTAADLRFKAGLDNPVLPAYDNSGNVLKATVAASRVVALPADSPVYASLMSVESIDASGNAVTQEADRTLILIFRRYLD